MNPNPQPQIPNQPPKGRLSSSQLTAIIVICVIFGSCSLCMIVGAISNYLNPPKPEQAASNPASSPPPVASPTPTPEPTPDESALAKEKLARDVERFKVELKKAGVGNEIAFAFQGVDKHKLRVSVTDTWHIAPYQTRLQTAQRLQQAWARIHSPDKPDEARISMVDEMGNEVGGSRVWGGTLIWVQEK